MYKCNVFKVKSVSATVEEMCCNSRVEAKMPLGTTYQKGNDKQFFAQCHVPAMESSSRLSSTHTATVSLLALKNCWPQYTSQVSQKWTRVNKIWQRSKYHGIMYYHFVYNFGWKFKLYLVSLLRYGNPDRLNLGTLKIKLQINMF